MIQHANVSSTLPTPIYCRRQYVILAHIMLGHRNNALASDKLAQEVFQYLEKGTPCHPVIPLGECIKSPDSLLLVHKLVYVPDKPELFLRILKSCHEHPAAGHLGRAATYELVKVSRKPKARMAITQERGGGLMHVLLYVTVRSRKWLVLCVRQHYQSMYIYIYIYLNRGR